MTRQELLKRIWELSFVKTETELYLDAHPDCRTALDAYYETIDALRLAMEEYEGKYGPLRAEGVRGEMWTWASCPWPWQNERTEETR